MTPPSGQRRTLDRYLSRAGWATRTEAREWILAGRVRVNGQLVLEPETWIDPDGDDVTVDRRLVRTSPRKVFLLNKPRGVLVTRRDPEGRPTVYDLLRERIGHEMDPGLRAVGRLDQASAGLLLFATDNDLAAQLLGASVAKEYRVKLRPAPSPEDLDRLRRGLDIGDGSPTAPAQVDLERTSPKSAVVRFVLREGRNRQIRRMAAAIGSEVEWLVRVAFGPLELGDLEPGGVRPATDSEIERLQRAASG